MFLKKNTSKKRPAARSYDPAEMRPVIRSSICTGEKSAGFQDLKTGRFIEVSLIRGQGDLDAFRAAYGIEGDIPTVY